MKKRKFRRPKNKKIRIGAAAEHSSVPSEASKRKTVRVQTAGESASIGQED
jgi:hypothetical protein